ncbi:MAG: hypothetical protein AB7N91_05540 [Candidatus Tectimicrobiota bacterium]
MSAPPQALYRPTLHQIRVCERDQSEPQLLLRIVREAVEHVARALAPEAAEPLRRQVAPERPLRLPPRESRYPIVRTGLHDVPGHEPLKAALLAYQEGTSLLLHFIWHWDGEADAATVSQLLPRRWPGLAEPPPNDRGESLLLSAVSVDEKASDILPARSLFASLTPAEATTIPLQALELDGATLYVQQWLLPGQTPWPALLLFHDRETEKSAAADRLATVDWPLITLYHLRLEHYAQAYRADVAPALEQRLVTMRQALSAVFTPPGQQELPHVLTTTNPSHLQGALVRLAEPQYALLDTLGKAELAQHQVRRELENLRQRLAQLSLLPTPGALTPGATPALLQATLAGRAQQGLRQMEADVAQVKHQAEQRTARGMEVLRTRNDILNTLYDTQRNWMIALVGFFLALGQVLDKDVARVLYTHLRLDKAWRWLGRAPLPPAPDLDDLTLLLIRLGIMLVLTLLLALLTHTGIRLLHRWQARWPGRHTG